MERSQPMIEYEHCSWNHEHCFRKLKWIARRHRHAWFEKANNIKTDVSDGSGNEPRNTGPAGHSNAGHDFLQFGQWIPVAFDLTRTTVFDNGHGFPTRLERNHRISADERKASRFLIFLRGFEQKRRRLSKF